MKKLMKVRDRAVIMSEREAHAYANVLLWLLPQNFDSKVAETVIEKTKGAHVTELMDKDIPIGYEKHRSYGAHGDMRSSQ